MRIAFDAKRAFQNTTGLGNYSRLLISQLTKDFPQHNYYLVAPKITNLFNLKSGNMHAVNPSGIGKFFKSAWRSNWVKNDLKRLKIHLYHGLSNEIPVGLAKTGIRSVVTIHDLIFERYPEQYNKVDVFIYRNKFRYACKNADKIIAISHQTKDDLIDIYKVPAQKIEVCYQSCDPKFSVQQSQEQKQFIKQKYKLPEQYFLYVGSIIERKNLLTICKAINALKDTLQIPLVVIGGGKSKYAFQVREYIKEHKLEQKIILLVDKEESNDPDFKNSNDFPAIYQSALTMIYLSVYEGFGLPVLEALNSKLPVILSNLSCLPEVGGDAAYYVDPHSETELINAMQHLTAEKDLRAEMIEKGINQAKKFSPEICAQEVMRVYNSLLA